MSDILCLYYSGNAFPVNPILAYFDGPIKYPENLPGECASIAESSMWPIHRFQKEAKLRVKPQMAQCLSLRPRYTTLLKMTKSSMPSIGLHVC